MRAIEDLEKLIEANQSALGMVGISENMKKALKKESEAAQKRIEEIRSNTAKLGDGQPATVGSIVYGFVLPTLDSNGVPVNYRLEMRKVANVKKDTAGNGIIYFGEPTAKYQRLPKYESERFFSSEENAQSAAMRIIEDRMVAAQREVDDLLVIQSHLEDVDFPVSDLTNSPDIPTAALEAV